MKKTAGLVVAAAVIASIGLTAPAASAGAYEDCRSGSLCVWLGQNFTQSPSGLVGGAKFSQNNASWSAYSTWDDDESWVNKSTGGNSVGVYALADYRGWVEVCLTPNTTKTGTSGAYANNGRSNRWKSGSGCYAPVA